MAIYWYSRSWRSLMARTTFGVAVVYAIAAFVYPHLVVWFVLAAVATAGAQIWLLLAIWRRFGDRLRSAGFRW